MIYGFLTSDPEWGEDCVMDLRNSLIEVLDASIKIAGEGHIVKSNKFNSVDDVKTDRHDYYPEMEPFLWDTALFRRVNRKEIRKLLDSLNKEDKAKYLIYLNN